MIEKIPIRQSAIIQRSKLHTRELDTELRRSVSLISLKTILTTFSISTAFHFALVVLVYIFQSSTTHVEHLEFVAFFFSDIVLWSFCLVPLVAAYKKKLQWHDPFFIFSLIMFGSVMTIYAGYLIDPEFTSDRLTWGSINFTESVMLIRLVESEICLLIFTCTMLYMNRFSFQLEPQRIEQDSMLLPAAIVGIICITLGILGFVVQWGSANFFNSLTFHMGSTELAAVSGEGKYVAFQKWAILTYSLVAIGFARFMYQNKLTKAIFNFFFISIVMTSVIPMMVYGSRVSTIYMIFSSIVIAYRFGVRFKRVYILYVLIGTLSFLFFITLIRGSKLAYTDPVEAISAIFVDPANVRSSELQSVSYLFHFDRVGNITSVIHYLHETGDYLYGQSLISGPVNLGIYLLNKIGGMDLSEIKISTEQLFIWAYGSSDMLMGRRPPSLPGEFFMQFGYIGILPLSILYSLFFLWLRKKQLSSHTVIRYWFFTILTVELLNSVTAEFGLIFKFLFFHLLPILGLYGLISLVLGRRSKRLRTRGV